MVEELRVGVEEGWVAAVPNELSWAFSCACFESPSPPRDKLPKPPSVESIPIETSLIISEDFGPPSVSPKDEFGGCDGDGEPKLVLLFAKALKLLPKVPFGPKVDV